MLAGNMKLTHFLTLAGGAGVVALAGGGYWWSQRPEPVEPDPQVLDQALRDIEGATDRTTTTTTRIEGPPEYVAEKIWETTGLDEQGLRLAKLGGTDLGTAKKKDAWPDDPGKVNLYQDDGHDSINRAKRDLDRDGQWDEKWTFNDDGTVRVQSSPRDDEAYTHTTIHDIGTFRAYEERHTIEVPSWEQEALSWAGKDLGTPKRKDARKGFGWKINVYQDDGHATANRAKLDLDRDDKWDEKWTFHDDGRITRKVAPDDDENYTRQQAWDGSAWADDPG